MTDLSFEDRLILRAAKKSLMEKPKNPELEKINIILKNIKNLNKLDHTRT